MKNRNTILICPLNWGLGHATRDIPIINRLLNKGYKVVIATESPLEELLRAEIPAAYFDYFPGPQIKYTRHSGWLIPKLLFQIPAMVLWLWKEKKIIKALSDKHQPVCIISDNRYGVKIKNIKSVIITHQLMIKLPAWIRWCEKPLHLMVKHLVSGFDECWIPDNEPDESLAGELVHKYPLPKNARLIGPLSRFMDREKSKLTGNDSPKIDILTILSGPEPQKSIMEDLLRKRLLKSQKKLLFVKGKPDEAPNYDSGIESQCLSVGHLSKSDLQQLIIQTPIVISRSGYSTIMDLWYLNRKAILIPTPGQTEQLYLGEFNRHRHLIVQQEEISTTEVFENTDSVLPVTEKKENTGRLLSEAISSLTPHS